MDTPPPIKSKPRSIMALIGLSFLLVTVAVIIDQTFRWTDHSQGFSNGLVHSWIACFGWAIYMLPWFLIVGGLYRWRRWERFRDFWLLLPSLAFFTVIIGVLLVQPASPEKRFSSRAQTELPANAKDLHYSFSGGGLADYTDIYYFRSTPEEIDRLIQEMHLEEDATDYKVSGSHPISVLPECPDHSTWQDATLYRKYVDGWFYYLLTTKDKTELYMMIGCI